MGKFNRSAQQHCKTLALAQRPKRFGEEGRRQIDFNLWSSPQSEKENAPPNIVGANVFPGKMRGRLSSTSSEDVGYCERSCASVENLESWFREQPRLSTTRQEAMLLCWNVRVMMTDWRGATLPGCLQERCRWMWWRVLMDCLSSGKLRSLSQPWQRKKKKLNGLERAISDPDQNVLGADAAALNQKCTRTIGTTPELLSHCSGC